ncbi:unnamed protein product [Prorocentrum cordatum]|uniref:Uncharacterized protein n=1 Tax=Prorocentrum cordatum TaxID=2364126 RepID=A0ABN9PM32_9DINO|nr:unnamed protein product [Polarella glacialis]
MQVVVQRPACVAPQRWSSLRIRPCSCSRGLRRSADPLQEDGGGDRSVTLPPMSRRAGRLLAQGAACAASCARRCSVFPPAGCMFD